MASLSLKTIWKNKRHFKLQIFGVAVCLTVSIFLLNFLSIIIVHNKKVKDFLATNVKYTTTFQTSLTGVKGVVRNIYIDSSRTQCFLFLEFGKTENITMNASSYQMIMTNVDADGQRTGVPEEKITGQIYMFGSTGIVGLYLKSDIPFESNLKQLTLRSYAKFADGTKPYFATSKSDYTYDQCHLFFNPGGSNAKSINFLESHQDGMAFDLPTIYKEVRAVSDEKTARDNILQFYKDLHVTMNELSEYKGRLSKNYNIAVPELPLYIKGDYFKDIDITDAEGNVTGTYERYMPATVFPGGTEFDWYNGNIKFGYYNLVPNTKDMSARDFIYNLDNERVKSPRMSDVLPKQWFFNDGTEFIIRTDKTTTTYEKNIISDIELYTETLTKYMDLKKKYQVEYLPALIILEMDSSSVGQAYTSRDDEKAIILY